MKPRILSLFSGIGALDLAVEQVTGGETLTQVEAAPYRRAVLARHWPHTERFADVWKFSGQPGQYDVICGGFPCRDISQLGSRSGLTGKHSGLWFAFDNILKQCQPHAVFIENVANLRTRGLARVLQDLAKLGFDACWTPSEAWEGGQPLNRRRLFLVAIAEAGRRRGLATAWLRRSELQQIPDADRCHATLPWPTDREGSTNYDGPQPGIRRETGRAARGLDARRRRARIGSLGDTVVTAQAVKTYRWCLEQLAGLEP